MLRIENHELADEARGIFAGDLNQCRRIGLAEWSKSHPLWLRLKRRLAHYLLVRIDPTLARRQWRTLPE